MHFSYYRKKMAQKINNIFSVRSILEKDKLTGTNFLDWARNLRIILRQECKSYIIDIPPPAPSAANATRAQQNDYHKRIDDATDVVSLMLEKMNVELQKQHEHMDAFSMLEHLKTMFQE